MFPLSIYDGRNCRSRIAPSDDDNVQVAGPLHFGHRRSNNCSRCPGSCGSCLDEIDWSRAQRIGKRTIAGDAALIRIGYGDVGRAYRQPRMLAVMVVLFGTATLPAGRPSSVTTAPF